MTPDANQLLTTPDHHFLAFDGSSALFLPMDRASYHRSIFLDGRAAALSATPIKVPLAPLLDAAREHQSPRTGWIFHIAHCGSTLLSRLIDSPASSLILREPPPLRQLGLAAAAGGEGGDWRAQLELAHAMAARRFDSSRPTIVKANVPVNFILPQLESLDPDAPMILLHFALEPYLLAVLRAPEHRAWVERISELLASPLAERVGLKSGSPLPVRAAALWLAQMLAFASNLSANSSSRSLDAEQLFRDQAGTACAAAKHLGVSDVDVESNAALLAGRHSKNATPFDEKARREREADDRLRLSNEIAAARRWIDDCAVAARLPQRLGRPLAGEAPLLLG